MICSTPSSGSLGPCCLAWPWGLPGAIAKRRQKTSDGLKDAGGELRFIAKRPGGDRRAQHPHPVLFGQSPLPRRVTLNSPLGALDCPKGQFAAPASRPGLNLPQSAAPYRSRKRPYLP